jgi:acyl-CoA synthetase (AMP-forming)/AMP-acid ligase II
VTRCLFGASFPGRAQALTALELTADQPSDSELNAWCRAAPKSFKVPRRWIISPTLPATPSGRIRKVLVREAMLAATARTTTTGGDS